MKPSWEWTEADISALILNGVREDHSLDYKACGALLPSGKKNGSAQESDGDRILGRFLEGYEFGPGCGHALGL